MIGSLLVLSGLLVASWAVWTALGRLQGAVELALSRVGDADLAARIREVEDAVDRLPKKWAEMVDQASRAEGRTRAIVKRARQELSENGLVHAGLETEAAQLRLDDGESGDDSGLLAVRRSLAHYPAPVQAQQEDWETLTRRKKYGV